MPIVVSFISQKGGVGKSTLARALLAVASHMMRARLADLDPQQASVVEWERQRHRSGEGPACEVVAYDSIDDAIGHSSDVELLIVDAPARANRATLEIAERSHLVVQPTGASADDLRPAVLLFHELVKAGIPRQRLVAAICRILDDTEEAAARAYMQAAGYDVLDGAVVERSAYRLAQNRGRAISETKVAKLNQAVDDLMDALLQRVTQQLEAQAMQSPSGRRGEAS